MSIRTALSAAALTVLLGGSALAQSAAYTTPHYAVETGDAAVSFEGKAYVNHGLVGVGRLAASTRDFNGETLGSFSSMALRSWRRLKDGSYEGDIVTLPDRGPNDVGSVKGTTDYQNRLHALHVTLKPYVGSAPVDADQTQLKITPTGGMILKDETGAPFTGMDPGTGIIDRGQIRYPSPQSGPGAGHISLDSEGVAYLPDGSFYVSDEYAPGLYLFDKTGKQTGAIQTVPALLPMTDGKLNFNAGKPPTTGRRNNQGFEAVAVSPDGRRLITILQSAAMQDTSGSDAATRNNTRILVYDISKTRTPTAPIGDYVLQLPVYTEKGDGKAPDATAAQSEMAALSQTRFLVLSRDSNGRGKGAPNAPVFKSVLLVDLAGATNLVGTPYDRGTEAVAKGGQLVAGITPVKQAELVNLLNPTQLGKFGMNLKVTPSTLYTLPEKLEAMALAPVLDPKAPNDFFLFVGNDNDFQTAHGRVAGQDFDAGLKNEKGSGTGDNENILLVYRLTLPDYAPAAVARTR